MLQINDESRDERNEEVEQLAAPENAGDEAEEVLEAEAQDEPVEAAGDDAAGIDEPGDEPEVQA